MSSTQTDEKSLIGRNFLAPAYPWNSGVGQERRRRIMSDAIAAVENNFYLHPGPMSVDERFGDGRGGKL
jgi:hypothetical protein